MVKVSIYLNRHVFLNDMWRLFYHYLCINSLFGACGRLCPVFLAFHVYLHLYGFKTRLSNNIICVRKYERKSFTKYMNNVGFQDNKN